MEIAFITSGVLVDGGGYIFYIGSDGKPHVKHVPGWNPETLAELRAGVAILEAAGRIRNERVAQELVNIGERVMQPHAGELQKAVGP